MQTPETLFIYFIQWNCYFLFIFFIFKNLNENKLKKKKLIILFVKSPFSVGKVFPIKIWFEWTKTASGPFRINPFMPNRRPEINRRMATNLRFIHFIFLLLGFILTIDDSNESYGVADSSIPGKQSGKIFCFYFFQISAWFIRFYMPSPRVCHCNFKIL